MSRRLSLLAAALIALYSTSVMAVGLGELELESALNQQFDAEIGLINVGNLEQNEIIPNLASQGDFDRVGVERNYQLTDLRFSVRTRPNGDYYVQVTSSRPIIEPFLNFIVEVIWPTGRILREYTVLLDPPTFGTEGVARISPSETLPGATRRVGDSEPSRQTVRRANSSSSSMSSSNPPSSLADGYGVTDPGDTLWSIALSVRPDESVSVQQTMLAIQRANPDAFINDNINLLKAGYVLRIPELNRGAETVAEAIAEVKAQNEDYAEFMSSELTQLDGRQTRQAREVDQTTSDDGELRLVAVEDLGAGKTGNDDRGVADQRALELESSLTIAREDLDSARRTNTELSLRLDELSEQVETLNDLVKLKDDQLAALRAELQRVQTSEASASLPAASSAVAQTPKDSSLLSNPIVLAGLVFIVVGGLVAAMIYMRRRRENEALEHDSSYQAGAIAESIDESEIDEEVDDAAEQTETEEEEEITQKTSDVLSEAEIYIAYGRFPQAIGFLQNALENEPARADIHLKLLEVYVQTEDDSAFNLQFEKLNALGDEAAIERALELQAEIPGAAETSAAAMDATIISSEPIEAIPEPPEAEDDELSFDLDDLETDIGDDLDLDDDTDLLAPELEPADRDDGLDNEGLETGLDADTGDELDLDLDLDEDLGELDATLQLTPEVAVALEEGADLDLDLDDDLDLDLDLDLDEDVDDLDATLSLDEVPAQTDEMNDGSDDLDLDLDDDLGELDATLQLDAVDAVQADDVVEQEGSEPLSSLEGDPDLELDLDLDEDNLALESDDDLDLDLDEGDLAPDLDEDVGSDESLQVEDELDLELDLDDDSDDDPLGSDVLELDDDLDLDEDPGSKLDLARAYMEMGDSDGAREVLAEVIKEGSDQDIAEANEMLDKLD